MHDPARILVETVLDARLRPHHGLEFGLGAVVPVVVASGLGLHRVLPGCQQQIDAPDDVAHLALGVEDQAAAAGEVGARSVHAEEIRKSRDRDAQVGRGPVPPHLMQVRTIAAGDLK